MASNRAREASHKGDHEQRHGEGKGAMGERDFQAARIAAAKALRPRHAWHRQRAPRPAGLGPSEQGENR